VIDASPHDDPDSGPGFHHADAITQIKAIGEVLGGGVLFASGIPESLATLGLGGIASMMGGAYAVTDGMDTLRKAK
jgi:hypothetical protein